MADEKNGADAQDLSIATKAVLDFKQVQEKALEENKKLIIETQEAIEKLNKWQVTKDEADKKAAEDSEKNQKALDDILLKQKDLFSKSSLTDKIDKKQFQESLLIGMKENISGLQNYKNSRRPVDIQVKAVGDIGSGNFTTSGTQTFAGPTIIPGVQRRAFEQTHMRDVLPTSPVTTDSVAVIRGVVGEGAPTGVAAGGLKPQSDADWVKYIIPITKVAHYYTIPEEWLEDVTWLSNDITQTGLEELQVIEDTKIISNSTGGEFTGLVQNSTAYAAPTGLALGVEAANNYDVLVSAWTQLKNLKRTPNFVITDNDSYARMILTKSTTGEYVFGAPNISIPNIFGIPIIPVTATSMADKFIIGDRNQAVIAIRSGVSVRFYDQHASNAIYNLVTIVIEERIALVVKRVDAFVYGDFSDARALLETA